MPNADLLRRSVHVFPMFGRAHNTGGEDGTAPIGCWCGPTVEEACPECDFAGCWQCVDGWRPCPDPEMYDGVYGLLVIHNAPEA